MFGMDNLIVGRPSGNAFSPFSRFRSTNQPSRPGIARSGQWGGRSLPYGQVPQFPPGIMQGMFGSMPPGAQNILSQLMARQRPEPMGYGPVTKSTPTGPGWTNIPQQIRPGTSQMRGGTIAPQRPQSFNTLSGDTITPARPQRPIRGGSYGLIR